MAYTNKHLVEVVCGFQFNEETAVWDSTYFGQLYEKIKDQGFTEKQERKGFQIQIGTHPGDLSKPIISAGQTLDDVVIFKDAKNSRAVTMGKNRVSFHIIKDYTKWEDFRDHFIIPFYDIYKSIGLGNGPRQCNVIYLNKFAKAVEDKLADYFTIISPLDGTVGMEISSFLQRVFNSKGTNLLITKLNSQVLPGQNVVDINLECGSVCINNELINSEDWLKQANETHEPVQGFFEAIISDKLRKAL